MVPANDDAPVSIDTAGSTESPAKKPTRSSSEIDRWLNRGIWAVAAVLLMFGAYFGYSYYVQQQQARLANPALHLVDQIEAQVKKSPKDASVHARLGEALAAARMYSQARTELGVALELQPDYAVAYQDLSEIALLTKDNKNAQLYLTKLLTITSTGQYQDVNGRRDFALFNLGTLALQDKRYTDAIGYLNAAVRVNNSASDSYLRLAQAYHGAGDDENAMGNVDIALKFDPKYAEALYFQGTLYLARRDLTDAAWDFRAAMDQSPNEPEPKAALAKIGDYADWFKKAQDARAAGDMKAALQAVEISRAIEPSSFDAAMLNGQILVQQGSYVDAVDAFKVAVSVQPKNPAAAAALKSAQSLSNAKGSK